MIIAKWKISIGQLSIKFFSMLIADFATPRRG